jgi:hypothetical protein
VTDPHDPIADSPLTNEMVRNRIGEQTLGLPRSY